ncbi:MAG: glycosyltransferase [Proteobacteria bacterium]|nr:glycosyltransferase [Pseudomonadota bacterium]MBU4259936.1 glycosyltransferase [Pseudomonadota bacterium]
MTEKWQLFKGLNGSKDNTVPIIKSFKNKYPDHILPIYLEKNCGTTYSRNLALKKAKGKYIIIMDSDVEIYQRETIRRLLDTFHDKKIGLVVPKPDGIFAKNEDQAPKLIGPMLIKHIGV